MAPQLAYKPYFTADEYLAFEQESGEKHEYIHGEIYAMAGGTAAHATISLNMATVLKRHLRGSPCQCFMSDMKLRVEASDAFFYPDVFVSCGVEQRNKQQAKTDAVLVIEVLSPSTAGYDRGAKFAHYRLLPDLHEYLVIDPETASADLYRKEENGTWTFHPYREDACIQLSSVHLEMRLRDDVFEDVFD